MWTVGSTHSTLVDAGDGKTLNRRATTHPKFSLAPSDTSAVDMAAAASHGSKLPETPAVREVTLT
jgi:hypothetical protein